MNRNLIGFILFVVAVGFGVAVLYPKVQATRSLGSQQQAETKVNQNKQTRLTNLQQIKTIFAQQPDRVNQLIATLPQEPQIPDTLVTLENMIKSNNITLVSLLPQINQHDHVVTVTLVGQGDLPSIENLTQAFADNNRPMSITSFSLNQATDNKTITFNMVLSIPFIPGSTSQAKGGA